MGDENVQKNIAGLDQAYFIPDDTKEYPNKFKLMCKYPTNITEILDFWQVFCLAINLYSARTSDWDLTILFREEIQYYWGIVAKWVCDNKGHTIDSIDIFDIDPEDRLVFVAESVRICCEFLKNCQIPDYLAKYHNGYTIDNVKAFICDKLELLKPYLDSKSQISKEQQQEAHELVLAELLKMNFRGK